MPKLKTPAEVETALNRLLGEYDYYCGVTSHKELNAISNDDELEAYNRRTLEIVTQYRSKLKALYWVLGEGELD